MSCQTIRVFWCIAITTADYARFWCGRGRTRTTIRIIFYIERVSCARTFASTVTGRIFIPVATRRRILARIIGDRRTARLDTFALGTGGARTELGIQCCACRKCWRRQFTRLGYTLGSPRCRRVITVKHAVRLGRDWNTGYRYICHRIRIPPRIILFINRVQCACATILCGIQFYCINFLNTGCRRGIVVFGNITRLWCHSIRPYVGWPRLSRICHGNWCDGRAPCNALSQWGVRTFSVAFCALWRIKRPCAWTARQIATILRTGTPNAIAITVRSRATGWIGSCTNLWTQPCNIGPRSRRTQFYIGARTTRQGRILIPIIHIGPTTSCPIINLDSARIIVISRFCDITRNLAVLGRFDIFSSRGRQITVIY